ncbi:glycosyltransferase family 1 protein [Cantharellus anzutake]|uniref:glycosyltransferase family 1 protein n=1 Tax=Cantharellus anzutake TaxID=1750568 RepID=UPI0019088A35|nr:glycosyltransferase family 1 protein [Cantharellus anzutake]KAF8326393.1 glycosyltransferase family 1 protein [Cantharellus anzutake]
MSFTFDWNRPPNPSNDWDHSKRYTSNTPPLSSCGEHTDTRRGGHTTEAITLVSSLDFQRYTPRIYIISEGDSLSAKKAVKLEETRGYRILTLPRARRVHQSFISTPPTFLRSFLHSFIHICLVPTIKRTRFADVLILAGPGTCVPVCFVALIPRFFTLPSPRIVYVESFARVRQLSLSGKILRHFVDRFIVQWPKLLQNGGRGEYYGCIV